MATCPLCNDTKTQEIHGPTGFLTRNCPRCVVEEATPAEPSTNPEQPLATNLNLEGEKPAV